MLLIALGLRRAIAIKMMPRAFKAGMSASSFRQLLRSKGLQYRWQTILGDWRTTNEIETKKDAMKYVRKDRLPSPRFMADVPWKYDKEYIYKVQTWSRIHPDEPLIESFGTIQSDIPLTPAQVEQEAVVKWPSWEKCKPGKLERVQAIAAFHRVPPPEETE